jgi:hypothetical protein
MFKMVEVIVTDRDGRVVKRVAVNEDLFNYVLEKVKDKPLDLTTVWFLRIMRGIFGATPVGGTWSETFTDTSGTSRTQNIKRNTGTTSGPDDHFFNTAVCNNRLWITYGTDSTPPTRTDYKLGNKLAEGVAGVTEDETQATVTISASFTMSADTTIYEVGLEWEAAVLGYSNCGRVLLDRTVFPGGIIVSAGQTITVVYRFLFP